MKKVVEIWQLMHYVAFEFSQFFGKGLAASFVLWLVKFAPLGRPYRKKLESVIRKRQLDPACSDPKSQIVTWPADYFMIGLAWWLVAMSVNLLSVVTGFNIVERLSTGQFVLICGVAVLTLNYLALWRNDKYLVYFAEFEGMSRREIRRARWLTLAGSAGALTLFVGSFVLMSKVGL